MKLHLIFYLFLCFFIFNCKSDAITQAPEENDTPQVLTEDNSKIDRYSKRSSQNIIDQLYDEALKNDEKLKALQQSIYNLENDSTPLKLKDYNKYKNQNKEYYSQAIMYAKSITDSTLKRETLKMIELQQTNFDTKISSHEMILTSIEKLKKDLQNQEILMKLFVTNALLEKYQKNELPKSETLKSLMTEYQKTIEETKLYTQKQP